MMLKTLEKSGKTEEAAIAAALEELGLDRESSTGTRRSKRPGRVKAGSRDSGRFVAARMMTPLFPSNPSISVSSWLSVCSRSSFDDN